MTQEGSEAKRIKKISPKRLRVLFTLFERLHHKEWVRLCSGLAGVLSFISMIRILSLYTFAVDVTVDEHHIFNLGQVALILILLFYLYFDWKLAIGFVLVLYGFYRLSAEVPVEWGYWLLLGGSLVLVLDLALVEKKKFKIFSFGIAAGLVSLVGPLWIYARSLGYDKREF